MQSYSGRISFLSFNNDIKISIAPSHHEKKVTQFMNFVRFVSDRTSCSIVLKCCAKLMRMKLTWIIPIFFKHMFHNSFACSWQLLLLAPFLWFCQELQMTWGIPVPYGPFLTAREIVPLWVLPYMVLRCWQTYIWSCLLVHELWPIRTGIQFQLKCRKLAGWNHLTFCRELSPIRCPFPQTRQ